MSFKQKLLLFTAVLLLSCALGGCGGGVGRQTLKLSVAAPEDSVWHVAAGTFAQLVEENSGGRWRVEIAVEKSGQGIERLLDGKTEFDIRSVEDFTEQQTQLSVFSLPWLFTDAQSVDTRLFNGDGREVVFAKIRDIGLEPLALAENGFRQVSNNRRPVTAPADFRGLSIVVQDGVMEAGLFAGFGAEPLLLAPEETFPVLRDGGADGQQNTLDAIRTAQIDKVQGYLTVWNGAYDPLCFSASPVFWDKLNEEEQSLFRTAAQEACAAEIAASRALDSELLSKFRNAGVEVTVLNEQQRQAFRVAAEPLYEMWQEQHGRELLDSLGYFG